MAGKTDAEERDGDTRPNRDNRRHTPSSRRRRLDGPAVDRADKTLFETLFEMLHERKRPGRLFRWVVGFAQSRVTSLSLADRRAPTLDLAQFALLPLGIGIRVDRKASDDVKGQWRLEGVGRPDRRRFLNVHITVRRREMEKTKNQLAEPPGQGHSSPGFQVSSCGAHRVLEHMPGTIQPPSELDRLRPRPFLRAGYAICPYTAPV